MTTGLRLRSGAICAGLALLGSFVQGCRRDRVVELGDEFHPIALRIDGTPSGGELSLRSLLDTTLIVTVSTSSGENPARVAERLEAAILNQPAAVQSDPPQALAFPLLRREGARLHFNNSALGQIFVTATDSGITTIPAVANVVAVRTAAGIDLRWSPVASATGYVVYRDGLTLEAIAGGTTMFDSLDVAMSGIQMVALGDSVMYQVIAHRDEELVAPPSVAVFVRLR